ncbi:hypothetical protein P692DRAFT_20826383 [Suillus brevipes Sb2]|nr:hypothetical protein P692DRAFT_20826383 [Suillus brevipes Sb2]
MVDLTNMRWIFKPKPVGDFKLTHIPFDLSSFGITPSPQDRPGDDYLEDAQLGP